MPRQKIRTRLPIHTRYSRVCRAENTEPTPVRVAIKPNSSNGCIDWTTLNVADSEEAVWPALLGLCPDGTDELMFAFVYRGDDAEKPRSQR